MAPSIFSTLLSTRLIHGLCGRLLEEGPELAEIGALNRQTGRHGMPTALDQQTGLHGGAHHAPHIETVDRTAGAGALAGGIKSDGESRAAETVLQARGEQADNAGMPVFPRGDDNARTRAVTIFEQSLRFRFREHRRFHGLSLAIQLVQPLRDHLGLRGIIYRQQSAAERRIADAAAGIDARPDQETEMIGCDRSAEPGLLEQRSKTCIVHVARGNQPFDHIGAVEALQRHHITYGGKRNDIEKGQQIECEGLPVPPVLQ